MEVVFRCGLQLQAPQLDRPLAGMLSTVFFFVTSLPPLCYIIGDVKDTNAHPSSVCDVDFYWRTSTMRFTSGVRSCNWNGRKSVISIVIRHYFVLCWVYFCLDLLYNVRECQSDGKFYKTHADTRWINWCLSYHIS